jgi:hypothetical protein
MSLKKQALAGMISPAMFALIIVVLTLLEYDFMVEIGWDPVGSSSVPWPSGLALGPYGWLQILNFVLFGLMLIVFAIGLHRGVAATGRAAWVGPALLVVTGIALVLSGFKTDPHLMSTGPQTWHGLIHGLAFFLLIFPLLLSCFFLWWRFRKDPLWQGYDLYSLITGTVGVVLFFAVSSRQWGFYLFLAVVLTWIEIVAVRLRSVAGGAAAQRPQRVR